MNSECECPSLTTTSVSQQHATKCKASAPRNRSGNCSSNVPQSSILPSSRSSSLLEAVSNYINSSPSGKRRHGPQEKSSCCLCYEDGKDGKAICTLDELKNFVHSDVVEILRPIWNGMSTFKTGLQNSWLEQPRALDMASGDIRILKDGTRMNPGNYVRTHDPRIPTQPDQWVTSEENAKRDPQFPGKLPKLVEEFAGNGTAPEHSGAPTACYSEKLKEKNREIELLEAKVHDLVSYQQTFKVEAEKIKRQFCKEDQGRPSSFPDGRPTLYLDLLNSTLKAAVASIDSFTTHFVAYSESRLHVPANKIWKPNFRNMYLARESHWTYALKAFFCEKMFLGFENESFMTDAASLYLDPSKLRKESFAYFQRASSIKSLSSAFVNRDAHFKTYCEQKFDLILPDAILLQPGDYDVDDMENSFPTVAEINLSQSFTVAAMKVWTLHKLCFAFDPAVSIFRARQGLSVDWKFMECVVRLEDDEMFIPKVAFMIAPGFRLRDWTVKSQVYPAARPKVFPVGIDS